MTLKAEVGGERGFEAAFAFRSLESAVSALEGEKRNTNMVIMRAMPMTIVRGLERRSDRTGPMADLYVGCPQCSMGVRGCGIACADAGNLGRVVRMFGRLPRRGDLDECAVVVRRSVVGIIFWRFEV